jgi:SAM-dependent methyltransferase
VVEAATDRERLVGHAYTDSSSLMARIAIYRYEQDSFDHRNWVLGAVSWPAGMRVLDVGSGPPRYLERVGELAPDAVRVAIDLSPGMATEASRVAPAVVGDAQALPFASESFDRVLAMHMLYHVPDIPTALREVDRVLTRDGRFVVSTNASDHMARIFDLVRDAVAPGKPPSTRSFARFGWESAPALLSDVFDIEAAVDTRRDIVVPEAEPVIAYVDSMRSLYEPSLPAGVEWDALMAEVRARVEADIARDGEWRTGNHPCYFVCRRR